MENTATGRPATPPHDLTTEIDAIWESRGLGRAPRWNQIGRAESTRVLFSGLSGSALTATSDPNRIPDCDLFAWHGTIPSAKTAKKIPCGDYIASNPYSTTPLRAIHQGIVATGRSISYRNFAENRKKWPVSAVAGVVAGFMEVDDIPVPDQLRNSWALADEMGISPSSICMSGDVRPESIIRAGGIPGDPMAREGKSVHNFWAYQYSTNAALWLENQRMFCVLLGGDPSIINVDRLMRTPGGLGRRANDDGHYALQTALWVRPGANRMEDVNAALKDVCARRGYSNPGRLHGLMALVARAVKTAHTLHDAGRIGSDAVAEVEAIQVEVRREKDMSQAQAARIEAIVGGAKGNGTAYVGIGRNGRTTRTCPPDTIVHLANGGTIQVGDPAIPEGGLRCYDPFTEVPGKSVSPSARLYRGGIYSDAGGDTVFYALTPKAEIVVGEDGFADLTLGFRETQVDPRLDPNWKPLPPDIRFAIAGDVNVLLEDCPSHVEAAIDEEKALATIRRAAERKALDESLPRRSAASVARTEALQGDRPRVLGSQAVRAEKNELLQMCRDHVEAGGFFRPKGYEGCGYWWGSFDTAERTYAPFLRSCSSFSCPRCAPNRIAMKLAAMIRMPLSGPDGKAVPGSSFIEREVVYRYDVATAADRDRWVDTFRKTNNAPISGSASMGVAHIDAEPEIQSTDPFPDGYEAFDLGPGKGISILSTKAVGGKYRTAKAVPIVDEFRGPDVIRAEIIRLGLLAHRVVEARGMEFEDLLDPDHVVPGTMVRYVVGDAVSTSRNLRTDADKILRDANPSSKITVVPRAKAPKQAAEVLAGLRLAHDRIDIRDEVPEVEHHLTTEPIESRALLGALKTYMEVDAELPDLDEAEVTALHADPDPLIAVASDLDRIFDGMDDPVAPVPETAQEDIEMLYPKPKPAPAPWTPEEARLIQGHEVGRDEPEPTGDRDDGDGDGYQGNDDLDDDEWEAVRRAVARDRT